MDEKTRKDAKPRTSTGIWITTLILVVLLLVSSALGATAVSKQIENEGTSISLTPEESEKTKYKTFYEPAASDPAGTTTDGTTEWSSETGVNLFSDSYVGADGKETVRSANGDKVVAPGTSNTYRFSVKNTGNVSLDYTIGIKGLFGEASSLPIKVRLSNGSDWIVGGENEYLSPSEVDEGLTYSSTVAAKKTDDYVLEWIWQFEGGNDAEDTAGGILAGGAETSDFNMTISTVAEVTPGAAPEDENGNFLYNVVISPALFATIVASGVLVIAICALTFAYFARKRKARKAEAANSATENTETEDENTENGEGEDGTQPEETAEESAEGADENADNAEKTDDENRTEGNDGIAE